jgi:hypothetical protein
MLYTIYLIAAVAGGTIMACQFVLSLFGMADHGVGHIGHFDHGPHLGGHDAAAGADGDMATADHPDSTWLFGIITFRTLVAAITFFGLAGGAAWSAGLGSPKSLALAVAAGFAAMYGMYWLMLQISRLASSGNERIVNAVGRHATVYVPIPAGGRGAGKVQLSMQNRIVEFQAVSQEADVLRTGETVEVIEVSGSDLVRVRRLAEPVGA